MQNLKARLERLEHAVHVGRPTVCLTQGEDETPAAFAQRLHSLPGTVLVRIKRVFIDSGGSECGSGPERVVLRQD